MCFACHIACGKAQEIVGVVKHEVMASAGKVPVMEVLDVCKAQVSHLALQRALQCKYRGSLDSGAHTKEA